MARFISMTSFKKIISPGIIQFILALFLIVLIIADYFLMFPSIQEITIYSKNLFSKYGYAIIVIAAFVEAFFMIGLYFPGSFVILLSVMISNYSIKSLFLVGLYSFIGFIIANFVNYFLGKKGYYKALLFLGKKKTVEQMQRWMEKRSLLTFFLSAFHPNFLGLTIVCAGIVKENFVKTMFVSSLSLAFWISAWILVATPFIKNISLKETEQGQSWYIVSFFIIWGLFNIFIDIYKTTRKKRLTQKDANLQ